MSLEKKSYFNSFHLLIILSCFLLLVNKIEAQTDSSSVTILKPILLDKAALSGLGLKQIKLNDTPERKFYQKNLFRGEEISVYVVSSESWNVPFDKFWFDEFIYILHGQAKVKSKNQAHIFQSGEYVFAPKGFPGEWEVNVGTNLHYELSVITNERADSNQISFYKEPVHLDKSKLSGSDIVFNSEGIYEERLFTGIELTIKLIAEKPRTIKLKDGQKEKLICLLSGQLIVEDLQGEQQTFYTGDYVVIPNGFRGKWKSNGQGMAKYITVEKS